MAWEDNSPALELEGGYVYTFILDAFFTHPFYILTADGSSLVSNDQRVNSLASPLFTPACQEEQVVIG